MQRLQSVFQRAALALALLIVGVGGSYGLSQPQLAKNTPCPAGSRIATAIGVGTYDWTDPGDNASRSGSHAACSCGNA